MIKRFCAALALAIAFAWPAAPASAACDYDVGGSPPFLMTTLEVQLDEELGCIGAIIADGTKGDITVSAGGTVLTINANAVAISTDVSGLGAGVATFLATPSSANLAGAVTGETGSGALVFGTSPSLTTPNLGTPSAATLTNATGLPISTGVSGLGTGVATALATPSSANLRGAVTDEVGTGALMFGLAPTMADDLSCTGSQVVRRNAGDTAFECATVSGGSLGDGDYGDITVSGTGTVMDIDPDTVGEPELDLVNGNTATNGDCLVARPSGTGGTLEFTTCPGAGGGITEIVQDTTPQLGGALDTNGFAIELGSGNTDTSLTRSAAGQISVEGVVVPTVSSTSTLTNKTLTAPVISTISNTGTITLPTATTTLVGRDTTDTLTNKSIAATQITAGALNIGNNAATVGTVEMANGTSNTLSASGGVLSIEGVVVPTISSTHTLTNKTISGGSNTITGIDSTAITDGAVANADLANMAQATVKGRAAGAGTGAPVDLSQTQLTAIVNTFTTSLSGAAPASGGGTTNFLRADGTWAAPGGGGSADVQTFNSSGTWNKPSGNLTMIECVGGGGSGAHRNTNGNVGGGGGGSYTWRLIPTASLGATETVTIGAGGAAISSGDSAGNDGGTSTFGSWLAAYGGGGGEHAANNSQVRGGGGAGLSGSASGFAAGAVGGVTGVSGGQNAAVEGGGASGGSATSGNVAAQGGNAHKGGAGGGAASSGNTTTAGGTSNFGGNGGASASTGSATSGSQPGGGGGGGRAVTSGAGGDGRCIATTF